MQSTRTNQGGSVLAFIVVGTVLALGVIGGVYLAHQRGEQQRAEQAAPVAVTSDKKPNTATQPSSETNKRDKPAPEKSADSSSNSQSRSTSQSPTSSQPSPGTVEQETGTRPNVATGPSTNTTSALPATGPIDSAMQLFALAILTAVAIAYIQSLKRQAPASL